MDLGNRYSGMHMTRCTIYHCRHACAIITDYKIIGYNYVFVGNVSLRKTKKFATRKK